MSTRTLARIEALLWVVLALLLGSSVLAQAANIESYTNTMAIIVPIIIFAIFSIKSFKNLLRKNYIRVVIYALLAVLFLVVTVLNAIAL
ncbi:hypothetical protein ACE1TF_13865 [Geomicrobium sp. JSM 1781026]|uniref:hypothetical protein n=1 Tax=Geomicrobium sp. JSM 1781026 TaxID=3344580 RepID=UPI0035C0B496